ncbi:MAG: hypothetical protein A2831_00060 [Candidatus Yanofskybacteria bacterium RIFCSPHIGHO2_01_FULL_44_17]|uniref:HD domain-containing protein n=1 Tax=Candidatus Yanofskybacteria bacterium RIFCSPHIGHO2_01_FULL_44_17 TaxID=1802668 RepID=A0A1F8EV67_9BACT|nr:MAG: hypothetical protein A2831_00060 [Candidatus Yanofskybacteria bacterium RIFCSPHIGHO2_01_FULL_44_17]
MTIVQALFLIDGPSRNICNKILTENFNLFSRVQGSSYNHQTWEGGYLDHITEVMNWAVVLYGAISRERTLPFSLSDALLVLFLHDIEKPWKYKLTLGNQLKIRTSLKSKEAQKEFRDKKLSEYGIVLSAEQENAMRYAEGENNDYTNLRRVMNELAGFCHICDILSARVFHNYPRRDMPGLGQAQRINGDLSNFHLPDLSLS